MIVVLLGLSLVKSSKVIGKVGSVFGLNDLNVSIVGIGDNIKVEVSVNLIFKFKVKYSVGIFVFLIEFILCYNFVLKLYL